MKTAGIVVDNYKLEKFKKELTDEKFTYEVVPFTKNCSTIKVEYSDSNYLQLKTLVERCERSFKM